MIHYFKNLLELSYNITNKKEQQECIGNYLIALNRIPGNRGELGSFNLPMIKAYTLRVYTESEVISSFPNMGEKKTFSSLAKIGPPGPNVKAEMNTNYANWRLLEKKICGHIKSEDPDAGDLSQMTVDDIGECAIFDAESDEQR